MNKIGGLRMFTGKGNAKDKNSLGKSGKGSSFVDQFLNLPEFHISSATQTIVEMAYQTVMNIESMS